MRTHIGRLFLAAGTAATLVTMPLAGRAATLNTPAIIITEVAWAGSSASTVDEWLELTNLSDDSIDLSGWTISGTADKGGSLTIPAGKSVSPHATFVIANYDQTNAKSTLARAPDYVVPAISLSNSALGIGLVDAAGIKRDSAGTGSVPLAGRAGGGTASPGTRFAPMVRLAPIADGTLATSWAAATASDGFDVGATDLGTPGAAEGWFVPAPAAVIVPVVVAAPAEIPEVVETVAAAIPIVPSVAETVPAAIVVEIPAAAPAVIIAPAAVPSVDAPPAAVPALLLSEFVSDAKVEWIEIQNVSETAVDLSGWSVRDATLRSTALPGETVGAGQFVVVENPAGKLNNGGDAVELVDPSGTSADIVAYGTEDVPAPGKDESMARDAEGTWAVTASPTKGTENPFAGESVGAATEATVAVVEPEAIVAVPESEPIPDATHEPDVSSDTPTEASAKADAPTPFPATVIVNEPVSNAAAERIEIPNAADVATNPAVTAAEDVAPVAMESVEFVSVQDPTPIPATAADDFLATTLATSAEEAAAVPILMVSITPSTTSTHSIDSTPAPYSPGALVLNEFVSDATTEWIEIRNPGNSLIDLYGWTVRDASKKETALPDALLGNGQFALVTSPAGKLNNDGDTIQLLDPVGTVVDEVAYGSGGVPKPKKNASVGRDDDGAWTVTEDPTPGANNAFAEPIVEAPTVAATTTQAAETTTVETSYASNEPQEPSTPPAPDDAPTTLVLSALYPNATGDDAAEEFISVTNVGTETVDLRDWSVADASGKTFSPSDPTPIDPGGSLTLPREETKIVLNNTSDAVTLSAPDGTLIDSISYDSPRIGSILRLQGSDWVWSGNPSGTKPGAVSTDVAPAASAAVAAAPTSRGSVRRSTVTGTVLVEPGVLGTQIFYVDDGDGGIQVYKNDATFPDLKEGDVVTVTGTITESRGENRLKVGKTDSISVVDSAEPEAAEAMAISDVDESDHGKLVRVSGIILVRSGSRVTLEDHGAQIAVRISEGTGIDPSMFVRGESVEVTGILVAAGVTLTLLPRSPDDVTVVPAPQPIDASAATMGSGKSAQAAGDKSVAAAITLGTLLSLGFYAGRKLIPSWNLYAKTRALRLAASAAR